MKHLLLAAALTLAAPAFAQDLKLPALSPTCRMSQDFSTSAIDLTYSRPSVRRRVIFGDVVPYGSVWRTGANSATRIKFGEDVTVGGQAIKAGEYALYTVPGKAEWEIILNKGTGNWGSMGYDKESDVARFKVRPSELSTPTQTFTMSFDNMTLNSTDLTMKWEYTKVTIPIVANNQQRLSASIDKAISQPSIPYFQAANYYYETSQNLDKAYEYVNKALEQNPKAYYMWNLKAKIAKKMGNRQEAIEAANKTIETAKGTDAEAEYARNGRRILNSYK
jgi:hypothetical protein